MNYRVLIVPTGYIPLSSDYAPNAFLLVEQMMNQNLLRYAANLMNQNQNHQYPDLIVKLIKEVQVQRNLL